MPFRIGPMEIIIILVIVLLVFGVGKLPQVGKSIGEGLKSFRKASTGEDEEEEKEGKSEAKAEVAPESKPEIKADKI